MAKLRVDKIAAPIVKDEFTGSVFFDGTGDYLSMPDSTDFDIGLNNEPFTWEAWFYKTAAAGTHSEIGVLRGGGTAGWNGTDGHQYRGFQYTDNTLYWQWWNGSAQKEIISAATPAINTWHHFAVSYDGTTTRAFLNGVVFGTSTEAYGKPSASNITRIGQDPSDGVTTQGYQSNVRICKGHAVYTENFTVPTRELEVHLGAKGVVFPAADNRTIFLACQSSTDTTAEATGRHKITANGNATAADANPGLFRRTNVSSTTTENTGSVFFDGSGDRLIIPTSTDLNLTGDFTIECWVYINSVDSINYITFFNTSSNGHYISETSIFWGASEDYFAFQNKGTTLVTATMADPTNAWYHIAVTRSGSTTRMFLNGKQTGSTTTSWDAVTGQSWHIGDRPAGATSGNYPLNGYISNLRVCKGHAVYTSDFAPPTRELEVHQGPDDDRTVLLACYDGENIFADKTGRHIIAAYGDRLSSPTPTATDSPIGITTFQPGLTRNVDPTAGPTFQGGAGFTSQNWLTLPKGTTTDRNRTGGRGLFFGGYAPSPASLRNIIDYVTISSQGNAQDFGDLLSTNNGEGGNCASSTRALAGGGQSNSVDITYVTISSTSNAVDFGDLITGRRSLAGASSSTRGVFAGGTTPTMKNEIEYVTIAAFGNALDFGDLTVARRNLAPAGSPTRGVFAGGNPGSSPNLDDTIDYITFASTGNATDFGNLVQANRDLGGTSSSTRAIFGGGTPGSGVLNIIDFITIATFGNAQDFGDLSVTRSGTAGVSNKIRGLFGGGSSPTYQNIIEFVTIASTGDAADFGDLTAPRFFYGAASDSHGGIS